MKLYAVWFMGYNPVGAVAVVKADDVLEALEKVYYALPLELQKKNEGREADVEEITEEVHILLDGEY
jgi:hypothetical protein